MVEVRQELQALVEKHESLERDSKTRESELALALESAKTAKAEAQKALQEIEAMKKIAAGKAFFMQSKNIKVNYLLLTRIRSSPGAFADLPRSVSDAAAYYRAKEGSSTEKVFWSQYAEAEHPVPLSDQLKQLVELHKVAEHAMKGLEKSCLGATSVWCGGWWTRVRGLRSSSTPFVLKVPVGPLPVLRCTGAS